MPSLWCTKKKTSGDNVPCSTSWICFLIWDHLNRLITQLGMYIMTFSGNPTHILTNFCLQMRRKVKKQTEEKYVSTDHSAQFLARNIHLCHTHPVVIHVVVTFLFLCIIIRLKRVMLNSTVLSNSYFCLLKLPVFKNIYLWERYQCGSSWHKTIHVCSWHFHFHLVITQFQSEQYTLLTFCLQSSNTIILLLT